MRQFPVQFPVFRVRAVLKDIKPEIWRQFEISERVPLLLVHKALQSAFGWQDYHLHQFNVGRLAFGPIDDDAPFKVIDELPISLGQVVRDAGDELEYEYDFGDDWRVRFMVEEAFEAADPRDFVLRCTAGERAGPPEDCGGPHGYGEFLEAYLVKTHPDHKQMRDWAGKNFKPEHFDLAQINAELSSMFKAIRKRTAAQRKR